MAQTNLAQRGRVGENQIKKIPKIYFVGMGKNYSENWVQVGDKRFNHKFFRHSEVGDLRWHTQTDRRTMRLYDWLQGQLSEINIL